jgi:outer membrane receptor protein involved in Fe transport
MLNPLNKMVKTLMTRAGLLVAGLALLAVTAPALQPSSPDPAADRRLEGKVIDAQGLSVVGAQINLAGRQGAVRRSALSSAQPFRIEGLPPDIYDLRVEAAGFVRESMTVDLRAQSLPNLEIQLKTGGLREQVLVTPSRTEQKLGDTPASVSVLTAEEIKASPAVVADDVLRRVPTFSLFRRTSSLSANPTAQGVSLRGIGPSGVSRTLVLVDDVPFNDPFGGWVYWTRVPLESIDRIEIVEGPSSSLYGNYAMGGVINFASTHPTRRTVEIKPQFGSRHSPKLDFLGADVRGKVGAAVEGSIFDTDGFPIVPAGERGLVDTKARVAFQNVNFKLDYNPSPGVSAFIRSGYFHEARDNAKISTVDGTPEANYTIWRSLNGGVRIVMPDQSTLQARLFADSEDFVSNYLAVPTAVPLRSIGRMSLLQKVPTRSVGGMAQWSRSLARRQYLTAGIDWRWIDADSNEDALDALKGQTITLRRVSGGTQRTLGAFVQDIITPARGLEITLASRLDHWRNYNAHNLETSLPSGLPGAGNKPNLPERTDTVASPRIAALYHLTHWMNFWGSFNWGFRVPTLNELYRQFRVGTVLTLPNYQLGPERLVGGEAGFNVVPLPSLTWRTTWFDNRVKDPVANVTIPGAPGTTTQQRQNLGRTRVRGVQNDVEYRLGSSWRFSAGYLFDQAAVTEFAANPALVGNLLPQVPKHRGSVNVSYAQPKYIDVAVGLQWIGRQFDDDQNARVVPGQSTPGLPGYAVVDLTASRRITHNLDVFLGLQNLLDRQYYVGTLPTTVGSPRSVNAGLRFSWHGQ